MSVMSVMMDMLPFEAERPTDGMKSGVRRIIRRGSQVVFRLFGPVRFSRVTGLEAFPIHPNHHYVPDYFGASARKQVNIRDLPGFSELASQAITHERTLLYYDRLFTIYQALSALTRLPGTHEEINVAEVGVYKGGTSYFIASAIRALGLESAWLRCFDTFEGHPVEDVRTEIEPLQPARSFNDTQFEVVEDYLSAFDNISLHKGRIQDTSSQVEDKRFRFVHLDVDIFEPTLYALNFFDERLVQGGVIVVDDYGFVTCPGASKAVEAFVSSRTNYFSLPLLTGQCVLIKH